LSKLGFAGQVDRLVEFEGKNYILDVKTGRFGTSAGAQMAAYSLAANEAGTDVQGIAVVSISRDGIGAAQFFDYSKNIENCQYAFLAAFDYWKFSNYKALQDWEFFNGKAVLSYDWSFNNRKE
jgi:hypothetical protein